MQRKLMKRVPSFCQRLLRGRMTLPLRVKSQLDELVKELKPISLLNIRILFTGTGKTLAAAYLATHLSIPLYRIDLSFVISKYIGETEKNLSKIFNKAENRAWVLFFDEADALFGKRTDVSDAHDKYTNVETDFLLQKMENHKGLVILASNLRENISDEVIKKLEVKIIPLAEKTEEEEET